MADMLLDGVDGDDELACTLTASSDRDRPRQEKLIGMDAENLGRLAKSIGYRAAVTTA